MIHKTVKISSTKINYKCAMHVTKVYLSHNFCVDNKQLLRVALKDWESCRGSSWQHYRGFLLHPAQYHVHFTIQPRTDWTMPILALKAVKNWKEKSRHKDEDEDSQEKDAVTILKPPEPKYKFIISRDKAPRSNCQMPLTNAEANNFNWESNIK